MYIHAARELPTTLVTARSAGIGAASKPIKHEKQVLQPAQKLAKLNWHLGSRLYVQPHQLPGSRGIGM